MTWALTITGARVSGSRRRRPAGGGGV